MKRLTINYPDGTIQVTGTLDEILLRLASYEDTGLEPEQVARMCQPMVTVIGDISKEDARRIEKSMEHVHLRLNTCEGTDSDYISRWKAQDAMTAENLIYNLDQVEDGEAKRYARAAIRVLERLKPANVRPLKWIPVTERLPDDRNYVLACFDGIQVIAYYYDSMWCEVITHSEFYPTHWMPLPEPPEGGADG